MTLNVADIEDAIAFRKEDVLNHVFNQAEEAINNGDSVLLERQPVNAVPVRYRTLSTISQLEDYKQRVFDAFEQLEIRRQELIGRLREYYPGGL